MPQALYEVLEGLESLLSPEEEDPPELLDAELFESSLAGLLGGGDAGRAACMHIPFPCISTLTIRCPTMFATAMHTTGFGRALAPFTGTLLQ